MLAAVEIDQLTLDNFEEFEAKGISPLPSSLSLIIFPTCQTTGNTITAGSSYAYLKTDQN